MDDLSDVLGEVLHELGWVIGDRGPLTPWQCSELTWPTIRALSAADQRWSYSRGDFSPTARALAYEAMFGGPGD